jgi:hypothetical protein
MSPRPPRKTPIPDWIWDVKVGDVLLVGRRRTPRVVRSFNPSPRRTAGKTCICFTITRCSWTGRCYTTYNLNDLLYMGLERPPVRIRSKMATELDRLVNACIASRGGRDTVGCCGVHGLA